MAIDRTAGPQATSTVQQPASTSAEVIKADIQSLATALGIGNLAAAGSESVAKLIDRLASGAFTQ